MKGLFRRVVNWLRRRDVRMELQRPHDFGLHEIAELNRRFTAAGGTTAEWQRIADGVMVEGARVDLGRLAR